jgi:glycosyltransferase involved in cell wall biosynthesis
MELIKSKDEKTIRILQITSSLGQGSGVLQVILNWHRNIDRTKIQFDYLYFKETPVTCKNEIESLGGKCYKLPYPSFIKPWVFIKSVKEFFKTHKYNTIHSHIINLSFFFFPIAKFYGTKNIIHHSHNPKYSDKFFNSLINKFLFFWVRKFITKNLACSDLAGKFLFKKNYTVINNGIDTENFKFNQGIRNKIRKELNIEDKFVIGHIGRFVKQKNHSFLIDIFYEFFKRNKNSALLLLGDGMLKKEILEKVNKLNLSNNVIFMGTKNNVYDYYQVMDCFIFPSIFEGLGIAAVEAQCSGLPCFISNCIPYEVNICNTTKISLSSSAKEWADIILEKTKNFERKDCTNLVKKASYDIKESTKKIQDIYLKF